MLVSEEKDKIKQEDKNENKQEEKQEDKQEDKHEVKCYQCEKLSICSSYPDWTLPVQSNFCCLDNLTPSNELTVRQSLIKL